MTFRTPTAAAASRTRRVPSTFTRAMSASSGIGSTTVARWTSTSAASSSGLSSAPPMSTRWKVRFRTRRRGSRTSKPIRRVTCASSANRGSSRWPTSPDAPVTAIATTSIDWPRDGPASTWRPRRARQTRQARRTRAAVVIRLSGDALRGWRIRPGAAQEQLEELARAAQTHVVAETDLGATFVTPLRTLGPQGWAALHLDALRPVLEALATTLGQVMRESGPEPGELEPGEPGRPGAPGGQPGASPFGPEMLGGMMQMLAPA